MKIILLFLLAIGSTGCSYYASNADRQYLQSKNGPELFVPKFLTVANLSHFYDLPPQSPNAKVNVRPPIT